MGKYDPAPYQLDLSKYPNIVTDTLPGPKSRELLKLFHDVCEIHGIWHDNDQIFRYMGQFEDKTDQLCFF